MRIQETYIDGVYVVETIPFGDHRGSFMRFFCKEELKNILKDRCILQINHSFTEAVGTVRGMHFQHPPHSEMKMVRCIQGCVWDVVIDLRKNSATFLKWFAQELSHENAKMMVAPEGVAHGFQTLKSGSEMMYLHTASYNKIFEDGLRFNDPMVDIDWPIDVSDISEKDKNFPLLAKDFLGI